MIKITNFLYINFFTVVLFIICIIMRNVQMLVITYAVMLIHELSHALAAVCIGLKISHITIYPFGINLKLKNKLVYSLSDEIILYISGPMCNAVFALFAMLIFTHYSSDRMYLFYATNLTLFIVNMLPALPLDGGFILKKILVKVIGHNGANKVMTVITIIISAVILSVGVCVLFVGRHNFSIILFSVLIIGNMLTQKEKYDVDFVKELMFHTKKKPDRIKHIIFEQTDYQEIAKKLDLNSYNVVYITDKNGKITDILTEKQIINHIVDTNITSL